MATEQSGSTISQPHMPTNPLIEGFLDTSERRLPDTRELKFISNLRDTALQHLVVITVLPDSEPLDTNHPYVAWSRKATELDKLPVGTSASKLEALKAELDEYALTSADYREALSVASGYEHRYQMHYHDDNGRINKNRIVELADTTEELEGTPPLSTMIELQKLNNPNINKISKPAERIVRIIGLDALYLTGKSLPNRN